MQSDFAFDFGGLVRRVSRLLWIQLLLANGVGLHAFVTHLELPMTKVASRKPVRIVLFVSVCKFTEMPFRCKVADEVSSHICEQSGQRFWFQTIWSISANGFANGFIAGDDETFLS